jgi:hypothetical protein
MTSEIPGRSSHSWPPVSHPPETAALDSGYIVWIYLGAESVFFYPPGSEKEHLVVDHGIPSVDMHWQVKGKLYDHAGDHRNQQNVPLGAVGDLLAVTHAHEPTADSNDRVEPVASAV